MPFLTKAEGNSKFGRVHVRATLALIFAIGLSIGAYQGWIEAGDYKEVALISIMWYFSKRQDPEETGKQEK
jgi:hypothetical protein